jgi:hypothetical protein
MKLTILLCIAVLCMVVVINNVECGVPGNQNMRQFFEYLRPAWRNHRARIRPFVNAQPAPMWRVSG